MGWMGVLWRVHGCDGSCSGLGRHGSRLQAQEGRVHAACVCMRAAAPCHVSLPPRNPAGPLNCSPPHTRSRSHRLTARPTSAPPWTDTGPPCAACGACACMFHPRASPPAAHPPALKFVRTHACFTACMPACLPAPSDCLPACIPARRLTWLPATACYCLPAHLPACYCRPATAACLLTCLPATACLLLLPACYSLRATAACLPARRPASPACLLLAATAAAAAARQAPGLLLRHLRARAVCGRAHGPLGGSTRGCGVAGDGDGAGGQGGCVCSLPYYAPNQPLS